MNPLARKVVGALLSAFAMSVGTTLGEIARDAIKEKFAPRPEPTPPPEPKRRGGKR